VRFEELRDVDGSVLAQGLHPTIAVVAANVPAREAAIAAISSAGGGKIITAPDVEHQLQRATAIAQEQHAASVEEKRALVTDAEQELKTARDVAARATHNASVAAEDLARFDDLSTRLASAEETYQTAVRADAEAARLLAAALSELDRVLGQRHSASASIDQARTSRDSRGVPAAVIQQAINLQAALSSSEHERRDAVQQADEISQAARASSRESMAALGFAHEALRSGTALMSSGPPDWGEGLPLPGLVTNYRDHLAAVVSGTHAAESEAHGAERSAESDLEQERRDLDALVAAGPPSLDPQEVIEDWAKSDHFINTDAIFADDAFDSFEPGGAAALITAFAARGSQVVYLTDNADLLGWAIGLPHEAGGASTIPASRVRTPLLLEVPAQRDEGTVAAATVWHP
jgi:hypothetical protein